MNTENVTISNHISEADYVNIARCHKNAFPQQFMSRVGIEALTGFYKFHSENNEILCFASTNNVVIGFILGGQPEYLTKYRKIILKKRPLLFILNLFNKDVMNSGINTIKNLINTKSETISEKIPEDHYYLSVIAVDSNYRGTEVAGNLVKTFEEKCLDRNYKGYYLNVSTENNRAIAFYKKQEMKIFTTDKKSTVMIRTFDN